MEEVYIDLEETPRIARSSSIQKITIYDANEDEFEGSGFRATYAIALDDVDFVLWTWFGNFCITILELLILKYLFESWYKILFTSIFKFWTEPKCMKSAIEFEVDMFYFSTN